MSLMVLALVTGGAWAVVGRGGDDGGVPAGGPTGGTDPGTSTAGGPTGDPESTVETSPVAAPLTLTEVEAGHRALGGDAADAMVAALEATVERSPVVVVSEPGLLAQARFVALRVDAPLVPAGADGLVDLLDRLDTEVVVAVRAGPGDDAGAPTGDEAASDTEFPTLGDREVRSVTVTGNTVDREPISDLGDAPEPVGDAAVLVVRDDDPARPLLDVLAMVTAARVVPVAGELTEDSDALAGLRATSGRPWLVAGTNGAWDGADLDLLAWDVEVVRGGHELPGGGLRMFPGRVLVALYGSPGAASLGVLGEQPVDASIDRARQLAAEYAPVVDEPVVPTFEIISTVASGGAESTGDYSRRVPLEQIEPWIDAAADAGVYVILDLQPGRTDFLTQAKELESLLVHPHVGLALDPEWRIGPTQVHLRQIGSVDVDEVQAVADWLADLTRREALPQKLLLLHQFKMSMLPDREQLQAPPELAVAIQMDGQGGQAAKDATWQAITTLDPPDDVWFGWKNFYDEDVTLRSPGDTMAVEPTPVLVSYQ